MLGYGGGCGSLLPRGSCIMVAGTISRKAGVKQMAEAHLWMALCDLLQGTSDLQNL